nr:hypothetical protein [Kutzneria buriramensis]WKX16183.1 hypothetical protein Q4V64_26835 [Kutzneria buriramensis]
MARLDKTLTEAGVRHRTEVYTGAHHGFTQADTAMPPPRQPNATGRLCWTSCPALSDSSRIRMDRPAGRSTSLRGPARAGVGHPVLRTPRAATASRRRAAMSAASSGGRGSTPFSVIRAWNCCCW